MYFISSGSRLEHVQVHDSTATYAGGLFLSHSHLNMTDIMVVVSEGTYLRSQSVCIAFTKDRGSSWQRGKLQGCCGGKFGMRASSVSIFQDDVGNCNGAASPLTISDVDIVTGSALGDIPPAIDILSQCLDRTTVILTRVTVAGESAATSSDLYMYRKGQTPLLRSRAPTKPMVTLIDVGFNRQRKSNDPPDRKSVV